MKKLSIYLVLCMSVIFINAEEFDFTKFNTFEELHNDLKKQAIKFIGSDDHQIVRESRNSRDYQVGDQETYWRWDLSIMPPSWIQTIATCRAVGEHCYVFVADEEWNIHMDESDVQIVFNYLENETMAGDDYGAVASDTLHFGPIPDELDNDPKLIVFYSALGSFQGNQFDGYFSVYNQVTEAEAQQMNPSGHSNECEMIYMTCHPLDPIEPVRISVLAHELEHCIHWGGDSNEDTWVDEGLAELAMVYFGMPDPISSFNSNPDNSLNTWNQQWADYVKTMLFFTYFAEHFDDGTLIEDIVSEPSNSITGISNQLIAHGYAIPFEAIFVNWTIANYLDDPDVQNGLYNYEALNLPNFSTSATHSSFPTDSGGSINPWAADYIRIYPDENDLHILLEADHEMSLGVIRIGTGGATSAVDAFIVDGILDEDLPEITEDYSQVILVMANRGYSSITYNYTLTEVLISADNDDIPTNIFETNCYPNPISFSKSENLNILYQFPENNEIIPKVSIFNMKGQKLREVFNSENNVTFIWNGLDENYRSVSAGTYIYRIENGNNTLYRRFLILD